MRFRRTVLSSFIAVLFILTSAAPAWAIEVFLNGIRLQSLKNVDLANCSVKFDADGNIQIISPGYIVNVDKDGNSKVSGTSDFARPGQPGAVLIKPKQRYVLMYAPNVKVSFQFEVYLNGKLLRKIGLDQAALNLELTADLGVGTNQLRVVARPSEGPVTGTENDIATLRVYSMNLEPDGKLKVKNPPVLRWCGPPSIAVRSTRPRHWRSNRAWR